MERLPVPRQTYLARVKGALYEEYCLPFPCAPRSPLLLGSSRGGTYHVRFQRYWASSDATDLYLDLGPLHAIAVARVGAKVFGDDTTVIDNVFLSVFQGAPEELDYPTW